MKKIHYSKCKSKNTKILYTFEKTLVLFIIFDKCGRKDEKKYLKKKNQSKS